MTSAFVPHESSSNGTVTWPCKLCSFKASSGKLCYCEVGSARPCRVQVMQSAKAAIRRRPIQPRAPRLIAQNSLSRKTDSCAATSYIGYHYCYPSHTSAAAVQQARKVSLQSSSKAPHASAIPWLAVGMIIQHHPHARQLHDHSPACLHAPAAWESLSSRTCIGHPHRPVQACTARSTSLRRV